MRDVLSPLRRALHVEGPITRGHAGIFAIRAINVLWLTMVVIVFGNPTTTATSPPILQATEELWAIAALVFILLRLYGWAWDRPPAASLSRSGTLLFWGAITAIYATSGSFFGTSIFVIATLCAFAGWAIESDAIILAE